MHAVAAGEIHPLFARAGFVGFAVGCAHDVAAAVAGNDLGGIGHERLGRVDWIKGMFAAAWQPCGEKVLYRNRQGSSETILYRVHLKPIRRCHLSLFQLIPRDSNGFQTTSQPITIRATTR